MLKADAREATPIMQRAMHTLLGMGVTTGRPGADLRSACGDLIAHAQVLIQSDAIGPPLVNCFDLARKAGFTQIQLSHVRDSVITETAVSLGAVLIRNAIIETSLATECRVIADMAFDNREAVDQLKLAMNATFNAVEETAADDMDQMAYQALISLHAALSFHLIETGRPLPRMIRFAFAAPLTTLVMAHRLYDDAGRADELRTENNVVHPAFAPPTGRALSA
jgi:prophage DNA circulation protein